jgi:glycosyltransferase involved in cell wall biosynthesis
MEMQATVIIPTFEDWGRLQLCLDCLSRQTADPAIFEVIVANNNASAEVPPSLRLPSNARVVHASKPGSYAARNVAIREARGMVLFFTDSDCQPDTQWIEAGLADIVELGPECLVAGGIKLFPEGDRWTATELYDRVHHLRQERYARQGWCATANLIAWRDAFDKVGMFNEDRFSGADAEWTLRSTKEIKYRLVHRENAFVRHPARKGFAELAKKRRRKAGGRHDAEMLGLVTKAPMTKYLSFVTYREMHRTMISPGLTDWQRIQVLGVSFMLGLVGFAESARLRYFSGKPQRS